MRATLYKVESNHNNVPFNEMVGMLFQDEIPEVGKSFYMENAGHWIMTTPVTEVTVLDEGDYLFKTRNSTYRLTFDVERRVEDEEGKPWREA